MLGVGYADFTSISDALPLSPCALLNRRHVLCYSFLDPKVHQDELKQRIRLLQLPSICYLNLCRSTDTWSTIVNVLPEESHAFKTKARVPTLLLFEMQDHQRGNDVATFLNGEIGVAMSAAPEDSASAGQLLLQFFDN